MRRILVALTVAAICLTVGTAAQAETPRQSVRTCQDHHPWQRVAQRDNLIWCLANRLSTPGTPRYAVSIAHCESGTDLQDTYGGDGYVGTFQHITSSYHGRWERWGRPLGAPDGEANVLGQTVTSVRMARAIGGWGAPGGWSCA